MNTRQFRKFYATMTINTYEMKLRFERFVKRVLGEGEGLSSHAVFTDNTLYAHIYSILGYNLTQVYLLMHLFHLPNQVFTLNRLI